MEDDADPFILYFSLNKLTRFLRASIVYDINARNFFTNSGDDLFDVALDPVAGNNDADSRTLLRPGGNGFSNQLPSSFPFFFR
jgi:hypothetical protein